MKIELQDLSPVKKTLAIEADPEEVDRETEAVLRTYARRAKVPGFRPGKVPLSLIRTRYAHEIREDVRERLLSKLYTAATAQKGLQPLGDPHLEEISHEENQPFRFRTTFEVRPEFTVKEYRGIEVREPSAAVTDADVEQALEDLRKSQVRLVTEEGRAASAGDVVVADVDGAPEGGEAFRRERVLIEVGASGNLPAFNEGILGVVTGSTPQFSVTYPKDYDAKHLAAKTVHYRMVVHEVKRTEYPSLDDEFAKDLGDFENLAALRVKVRADLEERKRAEARAAVRQSVLDKVLLANPIPLPEVLVQEETQHRLEDIVRAMILQGLDPRRMEVDWKELRERQDEPARKAVHARLLLDSVASAEPIAVEAAEIEDRIRKEAERIRQDPHELRKSLSKGDGLEALKNQMVREKTLDFLTSIANIHPEG